MMEQYKLGEMEEKFAELIWKHAPIASGELTKLCENEFGWKRTTTYTMLKRLCQRSLFENDNPIHLELGCGKGGFISELASQNLGVNYIAIDMVDAMLGLAKRNIERVYAEKNLPVKNVFLTRFDIERILLIMDDTDKIDRIYINFYT